VAGNLGQHFAGHVFLVGWKGENNFQNNKFVADDAISVIIHCVECFYDLVLALKGRCPNNFRIFRVQQKLLCSLLCGTTMHWSFVPMIIMPSLHTMTLINCMG
jgi:hypothetical protein